MDAKLNAIAEAALKLESYVSVKAIETANELGFGWQPAPDAPDTYPSLQEAYKLSRTVLTDLPVSSLHCDTVVFPNQRTNYAMRYWHDTLHVRLDLSFALSNELELGLHHLSIAERDGIRKHSLEWEMLRVDLLGQNYLLGIAGRFPKDQRQFVIGCLQHGLDEGIMAEIEQE